MTFNCSFGLNAVKLEVKASLPNYIKLQNLPMIYVVIMLINCTIETLDYHLFSKETIKLIQECSKLLFPT